MIPSDLLTTPRILLFGSQLGGYKINEQDIEDEITTFLFNFTAHFNQFRRLYQTLVERRQFFTAQNSSRETFSQHNYAEISGLFE